MRPNLLDRMPMKDVNIHNQMVPYYSDLDDYPEPRKKVPVRAKRGG